MTRPLRLIPAVVLIISSVLRGDTSLVILGGLLFIATSKLIYENAR